MAAVVTDSLGRRRRDRRLYVAGDLLAAAVGWALFWYLEGNEQFADRRFGWGLVLLPAVWGLVYALFDQYRDLYRQSRFRALFHTILLSVGVSLLFYILFLPDLVATLTYGALHCALTLIVRMVLLTRASNRLKTGTVTFNTLLIGGSDRALNLYSEIRHQPKGHGYRFVGFVDTRRKTPPLLAAELPQLGHLRDLAALIEAQHIDEVIIAIETSQHNRLREILTTLFDFEERGVLVKIIPDMYDIMLGSVKMDHVFGAALIEIRQEMMPRWQRIVKRLLDLTASLSLLVLLAPVMAYIALRVRLSSPGPIFYAQERIGLNGRPFRIFKFRSMYVDAEAAGPKLSNDHDPRCTPWGAVMRKWRLDELPQFWNVLRNEMSLVGPRPERQYFIDRINAVAPHYRHLLKVRPGITSWGQVKYGYASNVEEMVQRLKYDILYIENRSLALDFKILFYTVVVLAQGRGK